MLARRAAAEIPSGDQNRRAFVPRIIQDEITLLSPVAIKPPVVKKKLPEASFFDSLQKLLGDDLVSIDVNAIQRRHKSTMYSECLHCDFDL